MNDMKLMLIIGAIFALLAFAAAPAMAQFDKVWDGNEETTSWHDGGNWDPPGEPAATDTVQIGNGQNSFTVLISTDDAACETLDIGATSSLVVSGKTLTLGDSSADTTSTIAAGGAKFLPGVISLTKNGAAFGRLSLHKWVTFDGGGQIDGLNDGGGIIQRAAESTNGIKVVDSIDVVGTITFLCDVDHTSDGEFGPRIGSSEMNFGGPSGGRPTPEPTIKGDGIFNSGSGTIVFTVVDFDNSGAPDWVVGPGTIHVTDDADFFDATQTFDITLSPVTGTATLKLDTSLSIKGQFLVTLANGTARLELAEGLVFNASSP